MVPKRVRSHPRENPTFEASQETTVCSQDRDCKDTAWDTSYCVTADRDLCPTAVGRWQKQLGRLQERLGLRRASVPYFSSKLRFIAILQQACAQQGHRRSSLQ